jgi:hypothetical protein
MGRSIVQLLAHPEGALAGVTNDTVGGFMADSKVRQFCVNALLLVAFMAFVFALGYGWTQP